MSGEEGGALHPSGARELKVPTSALSVVVESRAHLERLRKFHLNRGNLCGAQVYSDPACEDGGGAEQHGGGRARGDDAGFGAGGEGFFRISFIQSEERIAEAAKRAGAVLDAMLKELA